MQTHVVYWLHDKDCRDPRTDGYIGVTGRIVERSNSHRRKRGKDIKIKILFRGTEEQCYNKELKLRPHRGIGWNINYGGPDGYKAAGHLNKGKKRTEEQRRALSEAHKGYQRTPEQIAKSIETKRRNGNLAPSKATIEAATRSWLNGRVSGMTGKKHSLKTRRQMSKSMNKVYAEGRGNIQGFRGPSDERGRWIRGSSY